MMTMMLLVDMSLAGTLFYIDEGEPYVQAMDTRTFEVVDFAPVSGLGLPFAGLAFDEQETLWMHYVQGRWMGLIWSPVPYRRTYDWEDYWVLAPHYAYTNTIVYDPVLREVVVFGELYNPGIYHLAGGWFAQGPTYPRGAAWDPNLGGFVVVEADRDIHTIVNYGPPQLLGTAPAAADGNIFGLAYDRDLHILWLVTDLDGIFGLDPLTYEQVAWLPSPVTHSYGGTSQNHDPVPGFEPELLVTGTCPGEVFLTAVDQTPGGQVVMVSGTRAGAWVSPPGAPCAGTTLGMRNPVVRATLTANSLGLASTRFRASRAMCGAMGFQAVDVTTCTRSSVRGLT